MGLLINSRRGVWSLTEAGGQLVDELASSDEFTIRQRIRGLHSGYAASLRRVQKAKQSTGPEPGAPVERDTSDGADNWKEALLDCLMTTSPQGFECLAQRLLREAGFISATVTGRSGDGGIDGLGVYRLSLVSFPVFFQCKRYRGSVGAGAVRDFRGAMAGRGDKGLLITTGTFTPDAKAEATRDGTPPADLIDGERLCDLLKQYELGVNTTIRQVEDVAVNRVFFSEI